MKSFQCVETVEGYKFRSEGFRVRCSFQLSYNTTAAASEAECATNAGKVLRPAGELIYPRSSVSVDTMIVPF